MAHTELAHSNGRSHSCGSGCRCGCVPAEFVRMRYFYGQLLGATDLSDEQAYIVGKRRFHNARLHGWGILCGLRAERSTIPPAGAEEPTTIIRVLRGAAIDHCGNEIIVPGDYCIDVNAWFLARKPSVNAITGPATRAAVDEESDEPSTRQGHVYVVVRYEECPSEPSFAPRDPCGCDDGGCEFARVRESFKLDLITADQLKDVPQDPPFPWSAAGADLESLTDPSGSALRQIASAPCPIPCKGGWLVLAEVPITLDAGLTKVTDVGTPIISSPLRRVLLSTSALQWAAAEAGLGAEQPGPRLLKPEIINSTSIRLPLRLVTPAGSGEPTPIEPSTLTDDAFAMSVFSPSSPGAAWTSLTIAQVKVDATGPAIDLTLNSQRELAVDDVVRVSVDQDPAAPVCDTSGRALAPLTWARTYVVAEEPESNRLVLADLPK